MKPLGGGVSMGDTTRNKQLLTTSLADVTPVWYLFDSNVRTVEWFSLFIIKTALDRNRRVVFTNTFFFLQVPFLLPTYSKPNQSSIISLKNSW